MLAAGAIIAAGAALFFLMAYNMTRDGRSSLISSYLSTIVDRAKLLEGTVEFSNLITRRPSGDHLEIIRRTYSALEGISRDDLGCALDIDLRDIPDTNVHQSIVIILDHSPVVAAIFINGQAPDIAPYFDLEASGGLLNEIPGLSGQIADDWRRNMTLFRELIGGNSPEIFAQECQKYSFILIEGVN